MRLNGEKIKNDNIQVVVIPRQTKDLVFMFKPVIDTTNFELLAPKQPKPPVLHYPGGEKKQDFDDKDYHEKLSNYLALKNTWLFLESISATEGLEWETVNLNDASTWLNVEDELKASEFTEQERRLLYEGYAKANAFDEDQLDAARERFLAGLTQQTK